MLFRSKITRSVITNWDCSAINLPVNGITCASNSKRTTARVDTTPDGDTNFPPLQSLRMSAVPTVNRSPWAVPWTKFTVTFIPGAEPYPGNEVSKMSLLSACMHSVALGNTIWEVSVLNACIKLSTPLVPQYPTNTLYFKKQRVTGTIVVSAICNIWTRAVFGILYLVLTFLHASGWPNEYLCNVGALIWPLQSYTVNESVFGNKCFGTPPYCAFDGAARTIFAKITIETHCLQTLTPIVCLYVCRRVARLLPQFIPLLLCLTSLWSPVKPLNSPNRLTPVLQFALLVMFSCDTGCPCELGITRWGYVFNVSPSWSSLRWWTCVTLLVWQLVIISSVNSNMCFVQPLLFTTVPTVASPCKCKLCAPRTGSSAMCCAPIQRGLFITMTSWSPLSTSKLIWPPAGSVPDLVTLSVGATCTPLPGLYIESEASLPSIDPSGDSLPVASDIFSSSLSASDSVFLISSIVSVVTWPVLFSQSSGSSFCTLNLSIIDVTASLSWLTSVTAVSVSTWRVVDSVVPTSLPFTTLNWFALLYLIVAFRAYPSSLCIKCVIFPSFNNCCFGYTPSGPFSWNNTIIPTFSSPRVAVRFLSISNMSCGMISSRWNLLSCAILSVMIFSCSSKLGPVTSIWSFPAPKNFQLFGQTVEIAKPSSSINGFPAVARNLSP